MPTLSCDAHTFLYSNSFFRFCVRQFMRTASIVPQEEYNHEVEDEATAADDDDDDVPLLENFKNLPSSRELRAMTPKTRTTRDGSKSPPTPPTKKAGMFEDSRICFLDRKNVSLLFPTDFRFQIKPVRRAPRARRRPRSPPAAKFHRKSLRSWQRSVRSSPKRRTNW
jgi:hypothetical protein